MMNYSCTLCRSALTDSKDRYLISGRNSFDINEAICSLPFAIEGVNNGSYVCRRCLSMLKKKKNLEHSYDKCLKELWDLVDKSSSHLPQPEHTSTPVKARAASINTVAQDAEATVARPPDSHSSVASKITSATVCFTFILWLPCTARNRFV